MSASNMEGRLMIDIMRARILFGSIAVATCGCLVGVALAQEPQTPPEVGAESPPAAQSAPAEPVPVAAPAEATLENGLITIQVDDVPLETVVRMFINITEANIIASSTNLTGKVTASLRNVEWRTALKSLLEIHNLTLIEREPDSKVYAIVPRPPDAPEPMFVENFVLRYKRPDTLVSGVKDLLGANGRVLHSSSNMLTVMATSSVLPAVRRFIEQVDQAIPQVLIEAKFVELNSSAIKNLGINWQSLEGVTVSVTQPRLELSREDVRRRLDQDAQVASQVVQRNAGDSISRSLNRSRDLATGDISGSEGYTRNRINSLSSAQVDATLQGKNFEDFDAESGKISSVPVFNRTDRQAFSAILTASEFAVTLSALQQLGGVDVISNPKIVVASGERATILVGRKDPEIKAVADTNLQGRLTYQRDGWIESGVRLEVTPVVNTDERISVTITPQLSRVIDYQESGDTRVRIPILSTREITSQFTLPSGRTVAIGGLTETSDRETVKKIPLLGDLPLIGRYLFSHTKKERNQDEIIIFVTLAIADADQMSETSAIPSEGQLIQQRLPRLVGGPSGGEGSGGNEPIPQEDLFRPVPR